MQGLPRLIMHCERRDFNIGNRQFNDKARTKNGCDHLASNAGEAQAKKRGILAPPTQNSHSFPFPSALFSGIPFVRVQHFGEWMYSRCCGLLWAEWNEGKMARDVF
jgi:hypothetical protein